MRRLLATAALFFGVAACFPVELVGRNADALFSTPREVPDKIEHPYRADARLSVLWVGHATMLIQMDDKFILADPVFGETVGQITRRIVEPGIDPKSVPHVEVTLISHVHQDHLCLATLDLLSPQIGALIVPDGGLVYVPNYRFPTYELARWEAWKHDGMVITAAPVRHSGMRWGLDDAWMSAASAYVIDYHGMRVYFGGDTAYDGEAFRETGRRFPGIDLAMLPIAPGRPHEFMEHMHQDPHEALQEMIDIGAKRMVPMHFDTFINGADTLGEPARVLRADAARRHLEDRVDVLAVGEQRVFIRR